MPALYSPGSVERSLIANGVDYERLDTGRWLIRPLVGPPMVLTTKGAHAYAVGVAEGLRQAARLARQATA